MRLGCYLNTLIHTKAQDPCINHFHQICSRGLFIIKSCIEPILARLSLLGNKNNKYCQTLDENKYPPFIHSAFVGEDSGWCLKSYWMFQWHQNKMSTKNIFDSFTFTEHKRVFQNVSRKFIMNFKCNIGGSHKKGIC